MSSPLFKTIPPLLANPSLLQKIFNPPLWGISGKPNPSLYKFLAACFYRKFSRPWCLLKKKNKKNVAINLKNRWVDNFFKFLYLGSFCFCYYNEYPVKQTAFLYLKLPFKPAFLVRFCYFWLFLIVFVISVFLFWLFLLYLLFVIKSLLVLFLNI